MTMAIGVTVFVVGLIVSVMLHEAGHFLFARRFGMKATKFFVGFGPTLWSTQRGETEYGVKAILAGGFVKIVGMTELEPVAEEDQPRAFYRQPAPQRAVVLAAGSVTHFLIAFVLLLVIFSGTGLTQLSTTIGGISPCVPEGESTQCAAGAPASPAQEAGLRPGDRVVSVNGQPVEEWSDFVEATQASAGSPLALVVERDGGPVTLRPEPVERTRGGEAVGVLGVTGELTQERVGPLTGLGKAAVGLWEFSRASVLALAAIPAAIPGLLDATFGDGERSPEGLVGPVGIGRVSGELLQADIPVLGRVADLLALIAGLNVFIGIFNLLPLLPLDGGHLGVLLFERTRAWLYRLFGRADPGRVDLNKLLPVAYLFLFLLIGLSVLLLFADIVNPVDIPL
jgi:membrane-associated protease RseP (regulator of RpoE activity)